MINGEFSWAWSLKDEALAAVLEEKNYGYRQKGNLGSI
jgi:hypothetical protein